jgi:hypothetical protein
MSFKGNDLKKRFGNTLLFDSKSISCPSGSAFCHFSELNNNILVTVRRDPPSPWFGSWPLT